MKRVVGGRVFLSADMSADVEAMLIQAELMDVVHKYRGAEKVEDMLNRFLRARKGDKKSAFKMLKAYLEWCEKDSILDIRGKTARQMLSKDTHPEGKAFHDRTFPHGLLGKCKVTHTFHLGFLCHSSSGLIFPVSTTHFISQTHGEFGLSNSWVDRCCINYTGRSSVPRNWKILLDSAGKI